MSLFGKILNRAAVPGIAAPAPAWPKGAAMPARRQVPQEDEEANPLRRAALAPPLRRQEEGEEAAQPLRRQEEEEEAAQPLHRQEEEEETQPLRRQQEEEEAAQPLRRQEEEEEMAQPLRRQEEEEEVAAQTLRRQQEEEEEAAAQPLRRQEEEEETAQTLRRQEEEEEAAQPLYRAADPMIAVPAEPLPATEDGPQEDLPDMQALRRDAGGSVGLPAGAAHEAGAVDAPMMDMPQSVPPDGSDWSPSSPTPAPTQAPDAASERPRVTIDQIDVVIQDDAAAKPATGPSLNDLSRRFNALYLRGL